MEQGVHARSAHWYRNYTGCSREDKERSFSEDLRALRIPTNGEVSLLSRGMDQAQRDPKTHEEGTRRGIKTAGLANSFN